MVLTELTPATLSARFSVPIDEARKIVSAIHREKDLDRGIAGVRREHLARVRAAARPGALAVRTVQRSALDPFVKYALETEDARVIETVRIPLERAGRFSVCVSSQVGCALACAFCATGRLGLGRNLESWEIVEQVRVVRKELDASAGQRVHGVVFQGMGEPLANLERILVALDVFAEPSALAIDARNVTVCTSGLPTAIRALAEAAPKVRLGWSLGSARPEVRRELMPIEKAHPLAEVLDAVVFHAKHTGLAPMWAVTPLAGVNDSPDDARALAAMARAFTDRAGLRPRISVIPYNAIADDGSDPFVRSSDEAEDRFRAVLLEEGFGTHKRYSGGADVAAACGQLAGSGSAGGKAGKRALVSADALVRR